MRKYIVISDISKYNSYNNITARLMYLHIACNVDTSTYTYVRSIRQLARDLDVSVASARHALEQLENDGLITTHVATHSPTHYATHATTQLTTHLHLVTIKDIEEPSNSPSNTPCNTPCNTPNDTPNDTRFKINNLNNKNNQKNRIDSTDSTEVLEGGLDLSEDSWLMNLVGSMSVIEDE